MIPYILYICIVLFLTYFGYFLSEKYRRRKKFYIVWEKFHQSFLSEVSYTRRPLDELISHFHAEGEFDDFLKKYKINHTCKSGMEFFSKEENSFLYEYFSLLGRSDYVAQKEYFSAATQKVMLLRQKSELDSTRYTDLYMKLGFLLGLLIVILLV